jgi:hypothetical protein
MQPSVNQSELESSLDYNCILSELPSRDLESVITHLSAELPYVWADLYKERSPHLANIMRIVRDGFEYLFDFSTELVKQGKLAPNLAIEDRIVAVHGRSQPQNKKRTDHLMRKHPLGPAGFIRTHSAEPSKLSAIYDKGHFIGHAIGGALHINLFPQTKEINRGWSKEGKKYTEMERYCRKHPQTYCFSRPIYSGYSAHPEIIEFGLLRHDGTLWVNQFPNCKDSEEIELMERLFRAKLAGDDDQALRRLL